MPATSAQRFLDRISLRGMKPGLERMGRLMALLGHPERRFAAIHVTGTNGKGSVCAILESVLRKSGRRTGLYTSPHVHDVRERIRIEGRRIGGPAFFAWIEKIRRRIGTLEREVTYFEILTAVAFCHFARQGVEVAVVEVGLGGRLDATNVLPEPVACVITNVDLEHTELLGRTEPQIAREKAAIVKAGSACVTGARGSAEAVIRSVCATAGVPCLRSRDSLTRARPLRRHLNLEGDFQLENLATALETLDVLKDRGWKIPDQALVRGLGAVRWPGRFERRVLSLGRREVPVLLDGAHNPAAVRALIRAIRSLGWQERPCALVFNCLKDKDVGGMAREFFSDLKIQEAFVPALPSERARKPEESARCFRRWKARVRTGRSLRSLGVPLKEFLRQTPDAWVLATGSFYLVGQMSGLN